MEVWKPVVGYEGLYEVSNMGKVRKMPMMIMRKGSPYLQGYKEMKGQINHDGYVRISLSKDGKERQIFLHRIVMEAFAPTHVDGLEVNHKDLNKRNNRLDNLEWVTHQENMIHVFASGRMDNRRTRHRSVICVDTGEIFYKVADAANHFHVNASSVSSACRGKHKINGVTLRYAE